MQLPCMQVVLKRWIMLKFIGQAEKQIPATQNSSQQYGRPDPADSSQNTNMHDIIMLYDYINA